jgi:hypothetical protein
MAKRKQNRTPTQAKTLPEIELEKLELPSDIRKEIYDYPYDLKILISKMKDSNRWGIVINRGPRTQFKLLFMHIPVTEGMNGAILLIEQLLQSIRKEYQLAGRNIELDSKLIGKIVLELETENIVRTYELKR